MWVILAFVSALCLGFYDISKKIALRDNSVVDVLTASVLISSGILVVPLLLSRLAPEMMSGTLFHVPEMDWQGHMLTVIKSIIVLSSWVFAYIALKHLPISVVSPWQATRPMWTLLGALLIFGERLNSWQWTGVILAIATVFILSFFNGRKTRTDLSSKAGISRLSQEPNTKYYLCLALAILIGAASGLYDKYMMRRYDHNAVQVYYTLYQGILMTLLCYIHHARHGTHPTLRGGEKGYSLLAIPLISVFLVMSDNVYMLALQDPDSMIAVVSTIRRGGTVIGFAYGLIFLKEQDPWKKILSMIGILAGLICLAIGSL